MEPPPEVNDDDDPARDRGDQGEGSGLACNRTAEIGDPLEEQIAVAGQRLLELAELGLGDVRLEIGSEQELRFGGNWLVRRGFGRIDDLEPAAGVGDAGGFENPGELGAHDLGGSLCAVERRGIESERILATARESSRERGAGLGGLGRRPPREWLRFHRRSSPRGPVTSEGLEDLCS